MLSQRVFQHERLHLVSNAREVNEEEINDILGTCNKAL